MIVVYTKLIIGLVITGIIGAKVSKEISLGNLNIYWTIIASIVSGLLWGWLVKQPVSLTYAAIIFDVVYAAAFIVTFIFLGDQLNVIQILGIIVALLGIAMMGWH